MTSVSKPPTNRAEREGDKNIGERDSEREQEERERKRKKELEKERGERKKERAKELEKERCGRGRERQSDSGSSEKDRGNKRLSEGERERMGVCGADSVLPGTSHLAVGTSTSSQRDEWHLICVQSRRPFPLMTHTGSLVPWQASVQTLLAFALASFKCQMGSLCTFATILLVSL